MIPAQPDKHSEQFCRTNYLPRISLRSIRATITLQGTAHGRAAISSRHRGRRAELVVEEGENLRPGIGLRGARRRIVGGRALEAVPAAGIAMERVLDAMPGELGVEPVGVRR